VWLLAVTCDWIPDEQVVGDLVSDEDAPVPAVNDHPWAALEGREGEGTGCSGEDEIWDVRKADGVLEEDE
jgi:hypothetical protein